MKKIKINDYFEVSENAEYEIVGEKFLKIYKGTGLAIKEGAVAEASERGAVVMAWEKGAVARAMVDGAIAQAWVKGAIAQAMKGGAVAWACAKGAIPVAFDRGDIIMECPQFEEKYSHMSREEFLKVYESLIEEADNA